MTNLQRNLATWLLACLTCAWLAAAAAEVTSDAERLDKIFQRSTLKIATPDARMHSFNVWVADDDEHRQLGLMYVRQMDDNAGMLFVYPQPYKVGMWMKNTLISLDMLFVDVNGKVVYVAERTTPQSLKTVSADTNTVLGVIELNAGTAERLRIRPGSRVMHPAFGMPAVAKKAQ